MNYIFQALDFGAVSLVSKWLPKLIFTLCIGTSLIIWFYKPLPWLKHLSIAIALWLILVFTVLEKTNHKLWGTEIPVAIYIFAGIPVLALMAAIAIWKHASNKRRFLIALTIPLLILTSLTLVNMNFGYYPTVESMFAKTPPNIEKVKNTTPVNGALVKIDFPSKVSNFAHRNSYAWLPPVWFQKPRPQLPAILILHGVPGAPEDWARSTQAIQQAELYSKSHHGFAPIMIFPDINGSRLNDTECVNGPHGQSETYLLVDVVKASHSTLGTSTDKKNWAVVGASEGGTCAISLALRHPNTFSTFVDISGDLSPNLNSKTETLNKLYGGDSKEMKAHDLPLLLKTNDYSGMNGYFGAGTQEARPLRESRILAGLAKNTGINTVENYTFQGAHTFLTFKAVFNAAYPWVADNIMPK